MRASRPNGSGEEIIATEELKKYLVDKAGTIKTTLGTTVQCKDIDERVHKNSGA